MVRESASLVFARALAGSLIAVIEEFRYQTGEILGPVQDDLSVAQPPRAPAGYSSTEVKWWSIGQSKHTCVTFEFSALDFGGNLTDVINWLAEEGEMDQLTLKRNVKFSFIVDKNVYYLSPSVIKTLTCTSVCHKKADL